MLAGAEEPGGGGGGGGGTGEAARPGLDPGGEATDAPPPLATAATLLATPHGCSCSLRSGPSSS